jgi:hypothetical protein
MAFDLDRFAQLRPNLFHLTAAQNLARIRAAGTLVSASELFGQAQAENLRSVRRPTHETLRVDGRLVIVRDQRPFHVGAIAFDEGWDMVRLVAHVNEHVFFWPGTAKRPVKSGLSHYRRYRGEALAVLRVPIRSVLATDASARALFSRVNSGAPRVVAGRHSRRGAGTYVDASTFEGTTTDVVEVVFRGRVVLPPDTEFSRSYDGPWQPPFGAAAQANSALPYVNVTLSWGRSRRGPSRPRRV